MEKIYFVFGYFHLSLYGGINKNPEKITKYASKECDHKDITERPQIFFYLGHFPPDVYTVQLLTV